MPQLQETHAVTFCEYPKLIYIWPLILMGPLFWYFASPTSAIVDSSNPLYTQFVGEPEPGAVQEPVTVQLTNENEFLGWVYIVALFLVLMTIGVDVERNYAVFWAVVLALIWLACWLLAEKNIPVFSHVYHFFTDLDVRYDRALGLVVSIFLFVPYAVMLGWAQLNSRWRITHNEFEHLSWGRADDSLARGAKRVRITYPDLFEFLLLGAGTIIVYSATGRTELRRIYNVPLLFLRRGRITQVLETTRVTTDAGEAAAIQAEAEESESTSEGPETGGGEDKL